MLEPRLASVALGVWPERCLKQGGNAYVDETVAPAQADQRDTTMKASDVYAMPSRNDGFTAASEISTAVVEELFGVDHFSDEAGEQDALRGSPLRFHEKLRWNGDYTSQTLFSAEFNGVPFAAIAFKSTEKSGSNVNFHVTDLATYEKAQTYVLSLMRRKLDEDSVVPAEADLDFDFSPARVARFENGFRMVKASHVGFETGAPVYDHTAACMAVKEFTKQKAVPVDDNAIAAFRGALDRAILSDRKLILCEMASEKEMLSGFFAAEGLTYVVVSRVDPRRAFSLTDTSLLFAGTDRAFPLIRGFWQDGSVDRNDAFFVDLRDAFGLTDEETETVVREVATHASSSKRDFLWTAVDVVRRRELVPGDFYPKEYEGVVHARLLSEDKDYSRFGLGDMQSVSHARNWWKKMKENMEVKALVEASFDKQP